MDSRVQEIIDELNGTPGLHDCFLLEDDDRDNIKDLEESRNTGVSECLNRKYTLVVLHDSSFRDPESDIVVEDNGKITFPPITFSEIEAKNVVSCSPSSLVHSFLIELFHMHPSQEDASLLIGFDL